jgi:hypothetical protein
MKLWARDIGKWNEETQKIFVWNKNMVRIVFRLVELIDDRVSFEEYPFPPSPIYFVNNSIRIFFVLKYLRNN